MSVSDTLPRIIRGSHIFIALLLYGLSPIITAKNEIEVPLMKPDLINLSTAGAKKYDYNDKHETMQDLDDSRPHQGNDSVNEKFLQLQSDPKALFAFLKAMPKGGELHYHIEGGVYPETMLQIAAKGGYCLDLNTAMLSHKQKSCRAGTIDSVTLSKRPHLYKKTLEAWSMQNFKAKHESAHDHFFSSFYKFMAIMENNYIPILASIMQRAASQHELYMEILIMPNFKAATTFLPQATQPKDYPRLQKQLLANPNFQKEVAKMTAFADNLLPKTRQYLGCDNNPKQAVCKLKVAFQYYVLREQPLDKIFQQTAFAFALTAQSKAVVGVNMVAAEDGLIAMRDYKAQMQIFNFFHKKYPDVPIDLHAGELSAALKLSPESYRFHIHDAIHVGGAKRIGHGVDIPLERDAKGLLEEMARKHIAVEINLTSNQSILQVKGQDHPLRTYLKHKVPVVLSTDDEGILRTTLTKEYFKAVTLYHLSYAELKQINRNALTYSFLPGKSLWSNAEHAILVKECKELLGSSCQKWVASSEKAERQRALELQLLEFEQTM